jgi:2-C-methyl-D-erythritol 4-phosphate cytidylyltransferase
MVRYFALIVAAGIGNRMGSSEPKQYLPLAGKPMIWHSIKALAGQARIASVYVALAETDTGWQARDWSAFSAKLKVLRCGGASRAATVRNALTSIQQDGVLDDDWLLVHDAARPCLNGVQLETLLRELDGEQIGGLLAAPVVDTLKRGDEQARVLGTESRERLWQAQTPQMFRFGWLREAFRAEGPEPTDEAQAIERLGLKPRLVQSDRSNLKVTYPEDLLLAEAILRMQSE